MITGIIHGDDIVMACLMVRIWLSYYLNYYLSFNSLENYIDTTVADEDGNFLSSGFHRNLFYNNGDLPGGHFTEPDLDSASGHIFIQ